MVLWIALLPVVVIIASDLWVYRDAARLDREHEPVVLRSRIITLRTSHDWTIACVFGWIVFFPLYVLGRRHDL